MMREYRLQARIGKDENISQATNPNPRKAKTESRRETGNPVKGPRQESCKIFTIPKLLKENAVISKENIHRGSARLRKPKRKRISEICQPRVLTWPDDGREAFSAGENWTTKNSGKRRDNIPYSGPIQIGVLQWKLAE